MAPRIEPDQARYLQPLPVRDPDRQVGDLTALRGTRPPDADAFSRRMAVAGQLTAAETAGPALAFRQPELPAPTGPAAQAPVQALALRQPELPAPTGPAAQAPGRVLALRQPELPAPTGPAAQAPGRVLALRQPELPAPTGPAAQAPGQVLTVRQPEVTAATPQRLVNLINEVRGREVVVEIARQNAEMAVGVLQLKLQAPQAPGQLLAPRPTALPAAPVAPVAFREGAVTPTLPQSVRTAALNDEMRRLTATQFIEEEARRQAATRTDQAALTLPLRMVIDTAV